MKLRLHILCDCGLEFAIDDTASMAVVVATIANTADTIRKHKCKVPAATDCKCGHSANLHPELAGGKGLQSCGRAGCPCVRYQPK